MDQLKSEISLEEFLKKKINSIPSYLNEFKLKTKIVGYKGRIIVLIEVLNKNWEHIFYSEITQYVYIRVGRSTKQMYLQDTLRLIAERSYPQVHMNFKEFSKSKIINGQIYYNFKVNIVNRGVKTAEKIHSFILIGSDDKINVKPSDGYSASTETLDLTNHSLNNFIQKYNHIKALQFVFPKVRMSLLNFDRIYPFNQYSIGNLAIKETDLEKIKEVVVLNFENSGFVKQEFIILSNRDKKYFKESKSEFNPYIIA